MAIVARLVADVSAVQGKWFKEVFNVEFTVLSVRAVSYVARALINGLPGERVLLLGNEAIARGAVEAGVQVAASYPGTPSSEILGTLAEVADHFGIYVEWSVNEKVALEVAIAASYCGLKAMASMKHVGLNVAHDAFMTAAHIGAKGGLVLVSADDPFAWSSQNEQDNRYVARQAYVPVFEPCNPQEAKDMIAYAFDFSEKHNHPVMLRTTTRVSHARSEVVLGEVRREKRRGAYVRDPGLLMYDAAGARKNRVLMVQRFNRISEVVSDLPYNSLHLVKAAKLGVVGCGLSYNYLMEAVRWLKLEGKLSSLKIGVTYPVPRQLIARLLRKVDEILVVEELEPFVEDYVRSIAKDVNPLVEIHGKDVIPLIGELSTRVVTEGLARVAGCSLPINFSRLDKFREEAASLLPIRPPVLCPGCSHRASLYAIKIAAEKVANMDYGKGVRPVYSGDIGCYGLGYLPPIEAIDSAICMGGSLGLANGYAHIVKAPILAVIGDSTFLHAGIPALVNAVYSKAKFTAVILDNDTTAMTGFQPHPGSGLTATGEKTTRVRIEEVAKGCGVEFVEVMDPNNVKRGIELVEKALRFEGPSVIVFRRRCELLALGDKRRIEEKIVPYRVDSEKCKACGICVNNFGCPAILRRDKEFSIDVILCSGCGVCAEICPYRAILR